MSDNPYSMAPVLRVAVWMVLGVLALGVLVGVILAVPLSGAMAEELPEFGYLVAPLLTLTFIIAACAEAALVTTGLLVGFTAGDRIFGSAAARLVDALTIALATATAAVGASVFVVPGPPGLALILIAGGMVGLAFVLVLLVLRALLRRAASMRTELDEVI